MMHALKISHNVIDIGRIQNGDETPLKPAVTDWLKENCGYYNVYWRYIGDDFPTAEHFIHFDSIDDAVAFKLRWL